MKQPRLKNRCATCGRPFGKPRTWAYCSKRCQHHRLGWIKRKNRPQVVELLGDPSEYLALQVRLESCHQYEREQILRRMYQIKPPNEWVGRLVSQVATALDQFVSMAPTLLPHCLDRLQAHIEKRRAQLPPTPQQTTPQ